MTPQELKNSILQLAIQGKLVEQRPEEGTGEELYQQIQAEKQRLIKEGKIKKEKPLPEISEDEIPFDIPESWFWTKIESVTYAVGNRENQIQTKEISPEGDFPVVSQGQSLIDGYTNQREKVINDLPLVMFGDHTRNVKYIDFPFVIGADGTKFHKGILVYPKFLYYWMIYASGQLRNRGYARHYVLLKQQLIPLPPLAEQKRIVAKIEELLPYVDRYEKAWNKLEELNKRFPSDLQKSILQLAIQGKLVEQRPEEGTGEELYQQIQAEKQRLIKEGKIKKEKPLPEISEDEIPFDIPESWFWTKIESVTYAVGNRENQIQTKEISPEGDFPVVSQGQSLIDGYTNQREKVINDLPLVMFGDHTRNVKYIDFPFVIGADGTKFHKGILVYPKFLYYWMIYASGQLRNRGYARHYVLLKQQLIPLPPLAEQKRIVAKIEEVLPLCEKLK